MKKQLFILSITMAWLAIVLPGRASGGPHDNLRYQDYPSNCLSCHQNTAEAVAHSIHYRWIGDAPDMVNGIGLQQGKLTNAFNSYCINILGDWPVCGSCHVGRGKRPDDPSADLTNIDCLACHNQTYAAGRIRLPDGSLGVAVPDDSMVRNIHKPTRENCLVCHAVGGGADGVKRGDQSLALINNGDPSFDVHMNVNGNNLNCQSCHEFIDHKVIGKGSDLRVTDDPGRGSEVACITCHVGKDSAAGHASLKINDHVARVACQTCHIPTYAKVETEIYRDWRLHSDGTPADGLSGPGHPYTEKVADLIPEYRFWNRLSDNYLLGDNALRTYDPANDTYPTSRPLGGIDDETSKLYPFKYKIAVQPKTVRNNRLIALDTYEYLKASGDAAGAVEKGLVNMGYSAAEPYEWITTDTFALLNHGIEPAANALQCIECHQSTVRLDLKGEQGYSIKNSENVLCTQCHENKGMKPFETIHSKHVTKEAYDCSWCHAFSRPERNLVKPPADVVTITRVVYDAEADTLIVQAASSEQGAIGAVTLTASAVVGESSVGLGRLNWKESLGTYQSVFTGVGRPASVTVASSGGGSATWTADTMTLTRVLYDAVLDRLIVEATSSAQPGVKLTASAVIGGSSVNLGSVFWRETLGTYRSVFTGVAEQPASVTLTSTAGGSDTEAMP